MSGGALSGLLVVETAERPAGEYCGRLLADLGAEVIKVERPGGAPTRHMGPFHNGASILFAWLNAGKRSVVMDLGDAAGRAALDPLLARADALVDDHAGDWCAAAGLGVDAVRERHPGLVHLAITPFGQGAPEQWQRATSLGVINAGGWAYHTPSETPPDRPPLKGAGRFLPDHEAAIDGALCLLAGLWRRRRGRGGQFIDLSEVEVQLNRIDAVLGRMLAGEIEPSAARTAYDMGGPGAAFACRDGHVYIFMTTRAHWRALCGLMGDPAWVQDFPEDWLEFHCTPDRVVDFRQHFAAWIATQDKHAVSEAAQQAGLAMVPVNTAADLAGHPQFVHRGFFAALDDPALGRMAMPTAPYRLSRTPVRAGPVPPLGGGGDDAR